MILPTKISVISILFLGFAGTATGGGSGRGLYRSENAVSLKPYFDNVDTNSRNVSAVQGRTGLLTCTVRNLGNRTVSWIRREKHPVVLSSGSVVFTSDSRVDVQNAAGTDHWTLSINNAKAKDQGIYECQVNTEPKINLAFLLNIVPAAAVILGKQSVFVKPGSTISLTCTINLFSKPPANIQWFRGSRALNLDSPRGGVSLENEKTPTGTTSTLLVTRAVREDSGNYTCQPSQGKEAMIVVHVLDGENPRAMQQETNRGSMLGLKCSSLVISMALLVASRTSWHIL